MDLAHVFRYISEKSWLVFFVQQPVSSYPYTQATWNALETAFSSDRLVLYRRYTNSDEQAFELHSWNTKLGATINHSMQGFELLLRNHCNLHLSTIYGRSDWYEAFPGITDPQYQHLKYFYEEVQVVKSRVRNRNNPPCIVAGLTFGFWFALFTRRVERDFWLKGLKDVFQHRPARRDRKEISDALGRVKNLRNRIAHHEPIFHRDMTAAQALIIELAECICSETAQWIDFHSELNTFLQTCPIQDPNKRAQVLALRAADTNQWFL